MFPLTYPYADVGYSYEEPVKAEAEPAKPVLPAEVWQQSKPDAARAWAAVVAMCRAGGSL